MMFFSHNPALHVLSHVTGMSGSCFRNCGAGCLKTVAIVIFNSRVKRRFEWCLPLLKVLTSVKRSPKKKKVSLTKTAPSFSDIIVRNHSRIIFFHHPKFEF